mmetsp:Transcript_20046/g.27923  ORF Transcript_20046/g.27923 Transcript_20046/m.27923 type:complete len:280 (+) Transcript_20046:113-952(+)|eukprot:CAMPEP_0184496886 /NCGR_PEP_ID=MMETSP0113_2-20130426/35128_1 /TAXON_ID=91329 /ORGANISM="Norrisiella sphaerica, Strain BC52" /LENGTH=279 /DNA_ID=CAMNT_0026883737 /DNA_START=142 /DNA_END=981 /DNA_ORIENTATION=+
MAACFEDSSHSKSWLLSKREVLESNAADILATSRDDVYRLRLFFVEMMHQMGKELKLRQRVISTSVVFFKRFYLKRCFGEFDPRITSITMLFLAAKVEETYSNAKFFVGLAKENKKFAPVYENLDVTVDMMLKLESFAMEALNFDLIVFHPYRPITMILADMGLKKLLQMAWSIANDSYRTDICLEHAPAKIAVAVIYLSLVLNDYSQKERDRFLEEVGMSGKGSPEIEEILDICGRLIELYRYYSKKGKGDSLSHKSVITLLGKLRGAAEGRKALGKN